MGFHHRHIGVVDFLIDVHQKALGTSLCFSDEIDGSDFEHFFDNAGVVWRDNLRTIVPIGLVAVVLGGIVARRDDDTGICTERADCI